MKARDLTFVFACILFSSALLHGQESRGTITGKIKDPSGAVVTGVAVRVVNLATNITLSAKSNAEGNYEFQFLNPGMYRVTAEQSGFKRFVRDNIELRVGDRQLVDISLELGATTESVTVAAQSAGVETASATVGRVVDGQRIQDLPIRDSNVYRLALLTPGTVYTGSLLNTASFLIWDNAKITLNGSSIEDIEYSLDGIPNMRKWVGAYVPSRDMVQEFKVETASYDAGTGHSSGGQINLSLKSGTNQLHGSAWEEARNGTLDANSFFTNRAGQPKPDYTYNHFGGSLGGPVYLPRLYNGRNRTFFFFGYEGIRQAIPTSYTGTVATSKMRQGDLSELLAVGGQYQIYDPATIAAAPNGRFSRLPFTGNVIPTSRINPIARKYMEFWPQPNQSITVDGRNNFYRPILNKQFFDSYLGKVDHQFSDKHRLSGRVNISNRMEPGEDYYSSTSIANRNDYPVLTRGAGLDDVVTLSPTFLLNFKYGFTWVIEPGYPLSRGIDLASLGFPAYWANRFTESMRWLPRVTITDFSGFGDSTYSNWSTYTHTWAGEVSKIWGNHSLRFGSDARLMRENKYSMGDMMGYFDFGTGWTRGPLDNSAASPLGQGLASFLLGVPTGGSAAQNASLAGQSLFQSVFFNDSWRVTHKLTLTLGLRWEVERPWTERFNRSLRQFDYNTPSPLQAAAQKAYAANPIPQLAPADFKLMGGPTFVAVGGNSRQINNIDLNNFSPRLGVAFQLNPKTVVRGGYGWFYDMNNLTMNQTGYSLATPFVASQDQGLHFTANLSNPFPDGLVNPAGNSLGLMTEIGKSISYFDPNLRNAYNQRWSLGIQRELSSRILVEIGYVGNRAGDLAVARNMNYLPQQYYSTLPYRDQATNDFLTANVANPFQNLLPGTTRNGAFIARADLLVPYPHYASGLTANTTPEGWNWYHSLQTRAEKRFSRGFSTAFSWTFSKLMQAAGRINAFDKDLEHVISANDVTHRMTIDWVYELPYGHGKQFGAHTSLPVQFLLGGWRVAGVYTAQSGVPQGISDIPMTGPFKIDDVLLPESQRNADHYYSTNINLVRNQAQAFVYHYRQVASRFGALRSDGTNIWDLSLAKDFSIREKMKLKFEGQFLNAFNHVVYAAAVNNVYSSDFGKVTSQANQPRSIQMVLRFVF